MARLVFRCSCYFIARTAELLYILLALISFFFIIFFSNDFSENNYLRIHWTDFCNHYTKWNFFECRWLIWTSFYDISRDVAMAINFVKKWQTPHFCCSGIQKRNGIKHCIWFNSATNTTRPRSCKILVKIGPVVSAEDRLTNGNCVMLSRPDCVR